MSYCKYREKDGVCLLRSMYQMGHRNIVDLSACNDKCSPTDDDLKLQMVVDYYAVILDKLPSVDDARAIVAMKRQKYLDKNGGNVNKSNMPSISEMAGNLLETTGRTVKRIVTGQNPLVPKEEKKRRYKICEKCQKFNVKKKRCMMCGCFMGIKSWVVEGDCKLGKWNQDIVSILIVSRQEKYLQKTIDDVQQKASGNIEILVAEDTEGIGKKYLLNALAKKATGKYLFTLDAHCIISQDWDSILKMSCGQKDIIVCRLDALDEKKWEPLGHNYDHCYLDKSLVEKWGNKESRSVSETMTFTGCGWMVQRSRFLELGGFDPDICAFWGGEGSEMSIKNWLSDGRCLLDVRVRCAHLFRDGSPFVNITPEMIDKAYTLIRHKTNERSWPMQNKSIDWLVGKFDPVPGW